MFWKGGKFSWVGYDKESLMHFRTFDSMAPAFSSVVWVMFSGHARDFILCWFMFVCRMIGI